MGRFVRRIERRGTEIDDPASKCTVTRCDAGLCDAPGDVTARTPIVTAAGCHRSSQAFEITALCDSGGPLH